VSLLVLGVGRCRCGDATDRRRRAHAVPMLDRPPVRLFVAAWNPMLRHKFIHSRACQARRVAGSAGKTDEMTIADSVDASQHDIFKVRERRMGARSEGKLTEIRLRDALEREKILLREKKELIRRLFALQGNAANHLAGLTLRQRQIMEQVLAGQPSKNIATDLGISQRTVENHRASIMKKTGCKSLPALIRLALSAA